MGETWKQRVWQEDKREREIGSQGGWERRREMKRAGVLFIHLPLHWSSLWKTETQRRNDKKGGSALSNHFSAHDISPSSCSSCSSLTHSASSVWWSSKQQICQEENDKKNKKELQTIRHNKSLIVGERKITRSRLWDVKCCANCCVCEGFHWLCFNGWREKFKTGMPIQRLNLTICARFTSAPLSSYYLKHEYRTFPDKNFYRPEKNEFIIHSIVL